MCDAWRFLFEHLRFVRISRRFDIPEDVDSRNRESSHLHTPAAISRRTYSEYTSLLDYLTLIIAAPDRHQTLDNFVTCDYRLSLSLFSKANDVTGVSSGSWHFLFLHQQDDRKKFGTGLRWSMHQRCCRSRVSTAGEVFELSNQDFGGFCFGCEE